MHPIGFLKGMAWGIKTAFKNPENFWYWIDWIFEIGGEEDEHNNIRYTLLNGVYQNWQEFQLWRKTKSPFLEQTFFSLFGLINVQRYGTPLPASTDSLWHQMTEICGKSTHSNGHHFSNPKNFSFRDNQIRMIDYGGHGITEIVEKYGVEIVRQFDPNKKAPWEDSLPFGIKE